MEAKTIDRNVNIDHMFVQFETNIWSLSESQFSHGFLDCQMKCSLRSVRTNIAKNGRNFLVDRIFII